MTSFAQYNNMQPPPVKGQLRQSQARTNEELWQEHRTGIVFVIVVVVVTALVFFVLVALKWRENRRKKTRRQSGAEESEVQTTSSTNNQSDGDIPTISGSTESPTRATVSNNRDDSAREKASHYGIRQLKTLASFLMNLLRPTATRAAAVEAVADGEELLFVRVST